MKKNSIARIKMKNLILSDYYTKNKYAINVKVVGNQKQMLYN